MHIRKLRIDAKKSLLEVSGALEIDDMQLQQIEAGYQLPEEDILELLIRHFDVADQVADNLWELAGYNKKETVPPIEEQLLKQVMMVIPLDNKVVYSDLAHVNATKKGVVIEFAMQGGTTQPHLVSRVGMSLEQAQELTRQLIHSINAVTHPQPQRSLPASKSEKSKKSKE